MRTYIDFMIDEANEAHNVDLRNLPATAPLFAYLHAASLGAVECKYKRLGERRAQQILLRPAQRRPRHLLPLRGRPPLVHDRSHGRPRDREAAHVRARQLPRRS